MNSPITGKPMAIHTEVQTLNFRKEEFTVKQRFYLCEGSGERFTSTQLDELNLSLVYNAYRAKHHILSPEEIKETREKYGLSAVKMSEILGFGPNSYGLYERGEIPSLANAKLLKLASNPESFLQLVNDWEIDSASTKSKLLDKVSKIMDEEPETDFLENYLIGNSQFSELTGYRKPSLARLKEMVVFFAHKVPSYKTKMNKLLFYADFLCFRELGVSISGVRYKAIPDGPVPDKFQTLFENLAETDVIDLFYTPLDNGNRKEKLIGREDRPFNSTLFSEKEISFLEKVATTFIGTTPSEIVEISHKEIGWIENEVSRNFIPYDYALELKAL
jgi:putative zinc finger/helix-turn-helix YgiT family protein